MTEERKPTGRPVIGGGKRKNPQWDVVLSEYDRIRVMTIVNRRDPNGENRHARGQVLRDLILIGLMMVDQEVDHPM